MSLGHPQSGEYNIAAYQMSALPYVTSSVISVGEVHTYEFPFVTRFIDVVNRGSGSTDAICIGFTQNGVMNTGNYVTLERGMTVNEEIRTTVLVVSCSKGNTVNYQILCGLTTIPSRNFLPLTGSNGHPGVG